MGNSEITVRMDERRMNKLEACLALQDSSVLKKLHEALAQLYAEYVPVHIRQDVEEAIGQEQQAEEIQQRTERRIAVIDLHDQRTTVTSP